MSFGSSSYGSVEYGGLFITTQKRYAERIARDSKTNRLLEANSAISMSVDVVVSRVNQIIEAGSIVELIEI